MIKSKTISNTQHLTQEARKVACAVTRRRSVARAPIFLLGKGYPSLIQCYQGNYPADPPFMGYKYVVRAL
jgi:hypothetical protein